MSSPIRANAHLLVGDSLRRAGGDAIACKRTPTAVLGALVERQREDAPDAWFISGSFDGNRRSEGSWRSSSCVVLDLDWEDPALPRDAGAHQALPPKQRALIGKAMTRYSVPGFAYTTPRGLRVIHVLADDLAELENYQDAVRDAAERVLRHLDQHSVPLWRRGMTGLRYDAASSRPSQAMRLPLAGQDSFTFGENRAIDLSELPTDARPHLDVEAALPPPWARAAREVAEWAQAPVELVAAELLVLACALAGNTRAVTFAGRTHNLAIQVLALLESGSGKSDVRDLLRDLLHPIETELEKRREQALAQQEQYDLQLERWKRNQRAAEPDTGIERPAQPKGSGFRVRECFRIDDHTSEGLTAALAHSPRGVLLEAHEAHIVLCPGSRSQAQAKASQERAILRGAFDGQDIGSVRKGQVRAQRVVRPFVAASLDAQPGMEERLFDDEDAISGSIARWLVHQVDDLAGSVRYRDVAPVSEETREFLSTALSAIGSMELKLSEEGWPEPKEMTFDAEAQSAYQDWLERLEPSRPAASGTLRAFTSHMRGRFRRIAGTVAVMRDASTEVITPEDVERATAWARYWISQHRLVWCEDDGAREEQRLHLLCERVARIYKSGGQKGVSPRDLRNRVGKRRYSGVGGTQRAIADLNAIGWSPRVPPKNKTGRRPQVRWHPPGASTKPTKPQTKPTPHRFVDSVDRPRGRDDASASARELIDRASIALVASNQVPLPPPGTRGECPLCGSSSGFGVLPDEPYRWHCHSDRHQGGGSAVDLHLLGQLGRLPSPREAVDAARAILGLGAEQTGKPDLRNLQNTGTADERLTGDRFTDSVLEQFNGSLVPDDPPFRADGDALFEPREEDSGE